MWMRNSKGYFVVGSSSEWTPLSIMRIEREGSASLRRAAMMQPAVPPCEELV
jgi:hypothetical protein